MKQKITTDEMISDLPETVHRYMKYTGIVGPPWIEDVWLKQIGRFRQGLDILFTHVLLFAGRLGRHETRKANELLI